VPRLQVRVLGRFIQMLGSRNLLASNGRLVSADTVSGEPVTMVVPPDQSSVLGWSWGPTPIKIPHEVGGDSMAHESQCCPTLWHSLPPFLLLPRGDSKAGGGGCQKYGGVARGFRTA